MSPFPIVVPQIYKNKAYDLNLLFCRQTSLFLPLFFGHNELSHRGGGIIVSAFF